MSTDKTTFTHTDGRLFTYIADTPHTTKDGRDILLKLWDTCCSFPDCPTRLVVKTATIAPWEWPNFQPAKFCDQHRAVARKAGGWAGQKARAEGLAFWRESEEGKAALAQRAQDVMGAVERAIHSTTAALLLTEGAADWSAVRRQVIGGMEKPAAGVRDTRYQRVTRALYSLMEKRRIKHCNGVLTLLR